MANYSELADISARVGYTINDTSRPTSTVVGVMMNIATAYINTIIKASSNATDTYKTFKVFEIELVYKMINNVFYMAEPEVYQYLPVEFTEYEIRLLRLAASTFYPYSWELGE